MINPELVRRRKSRVAVATLTDFGITTWSASPLAAANQSTTLLVGGSTSFFTSSGRWSTSARTP